MKNGFTSLTIRLASILWVVPFLTQPGTAAISIDGIEDRQVYTDAVSFTVLADTASSYRAVLNGQAVAIDTPILVPKPGYYELHIFEGVGSSQERLRKRVQFIVRASERGRSEWGLPKHTPMPLIDSADAEFAGATLSLVASSRFPTGLDIPMIAQVEDTEGQRLGVNGSVTLGEANSLSLPLLRGIGSAFVPAIQTSELLAIQAGIASLKQSLEIQVEANTTWQSVSDDIVGVTEWPENSRIHLTELIDDHLTLTQETMLTIGAGTVVLIDPNVTLEVQGELIIHGTQSNPVVFTTRDRTQPWGGLVFKTENARAQITGAIFTASGADSQWFKHHPGHGSAHRKGQCLFYLADQTHVTLTDCYMIQNEGQIGHGENSFLTMTHCLVQGCQTLGQYNGGATVFDSCALIEFPRAGEAYLDTDNDAIYLTRGEHRFTDCLIGWCLDDGIDAGGSSDGDLEVQNCWFEACYHEGMALSGNDKQVRVEDSVFMDCGQGVECGYDAPNVTMYHCLATANLTGARFADNYDWTYNGFLSVSDSLLLFNHRDVWGRNWDDWTVRLAQMEITNNYLSNTDPCFPNNETWEPELKPVQLDALNAFVTGTAHEVGIGLALSEPQLDLSALPETIPVRLSRFTTQTVSVDYTLETNEGVVDANTLHFRPGQVRLPIPITLPDPETLEQVTITLSNPIHAQITTHREVMYTHPESYDRSYIRVGDTWRYFKGLSEPPATWNQIQFDDSSWDQGPTGIGYEGGSGYQSCIATNLEDMRGHYLSVYARHLFTIEDPSVLTTLTFTMNWDDGYIAYLNGVRIDSQSAPDPLAFDQSATTSNHEACCDGSCAESIDMTSSIPLLQTGFNVLAVQVHNQSLSSSDFLFIPELYGTVTSP